MSKKEKQYPNLWELKPKRNADWETTDEGKVVVLVPKFRNPILAKWVMPRLAKPFFRIKLDGVGSLIWKHLDGVTTMGEIAESVRVSFGKSIEPIDSRMNHFLNQLERGDLVKIGNNIS